MLFIELLKAQGLSDEQIAIIAQDMHENKIFITYEEKIEERFRKMKLQRDQVKTKLHLAEAVVEELNRVFINDKDMAIKKSNKS